MTRYELNGAMLKRITETVSKGITARELYAHAPVQILFDAMVAEQLSTTYWRDTAGTILNYWIRGECADERTRAMAVAVLSGIIMEWRNATKAAESFRDAIGILSRWDPCGEARAFIDRDSIEKEGGQ